MSTVTFRYENNLQNVVKGVKETTKEQIIDGEKGISFTFLKKVGDKSFFKIHVKQVDADKFQVMEKVNEKVNEKEVNEKELVKMIKDNKDLKFVQVYVFLSFML